MCEEIITAIDKKMREEFTLTKGLSLILIAASFLIGILVGSACAKGSCKKNLCSSDCDEESFDDEITFDDSDSE